MPANVKVKTKTLAGYLHTVAMVMPKGSNTIPVGISVKDNKFSMVTDAGGIYTEMSEVVASKDEAQVTCLYCDMAALLSGDETEFDIDQYGVKMRGPGYETTFPIAYSSIEHIDRTGIQFQPMHDNGYIDSLKTIVRMNPEKLFSAIHPVTIYKDISLLRYPSMYVQARTMSIPFTATFDLSHIRILTSLCPEEVSTDFADSALFKRGSLFVQLPCKYMVEDNNFLHLLEGMESVSLIDVTDHQNRLRNSVKFKGHIVCNISLYPSGLRTTITTENAGISVLTGETIQEPIITFTFPYQVWIAILTALGQGQVQILTGGQKICLRTQNLAILTSVIL